ncbi:Leucine Rich Repeat [Seminavis robusta]|uniref:Leucine Rich Repeat n=1 Tax=Seminavis robusta TaxID=568900 RepID=A0A9N8DXU4_9STRA|nr:Leucine Rich Repeat [Seminavis robusta]|eukprot:Sro449_g145420.1 Leucine Rich Repeat (298) ;mRNA; r:64864-66136
MAFEWLVEEIDILHNLTEQRVVQRFVLATFYFANSDERWFLSDNWLNHSVHECLWYSGMEEWVLFLAKGNISGSPWDYVSPCEQDPAAYLEDGVLYQRNGILKHFWLPYNGLIGSGIPPELNLLTDLETLVLDELKLISTMPEELFGLTNLEFLSMNDCGLYGSIPEAIGHSIIPVFACKLNINPRSYRQSANRTTTNRTWIVDNLPFSLDTNLFTSTIPMELGRLTLLEGILLYSLMLSGTIPSELALLTDMEHLELDDSGLTGTIPRWLGNMTSIEGLTMGDNSSLELSQQNLAF